MIISFQKVVDHGLRGARLFDAAKVSRENELSTTGVAMKNLIIASIMCISGCGTSAIVRTNTGEYYEGTITGHNEGRVFLRGKVVEKENIEDIDHPGNVAAIIGGIVAGVGALTASHNCTEETRAVEGDAPCSSSGLWLLTGVPIMIYGIVTHSNSVSAAGQ